MGVCMMSKGMQKPPRRRWTWTVVLIVSILLNLVGFLWFSARLDRHIEFARAVRPYMEKRHGKARLLYGDGPYSLFWGNDGVAMECGLLAKLPESDVLFCAKEAASAGGGQTFWFAARNMYVTWRCAGDGRCSQIAMQYNDAPLMEDLTGEGRFKDTVSPKPQGASALRDMPIPK